MDVSVFGDFTYDNEEAWNDFVLVNGLQHKLYNYMLQELGVTLAGYDLIDLDDTKDSREDWLSNHYKAHETLAVVLHLAAPPDLLDIELNDDNQFSNWLQIHQQIHQQLDSIFEV